MSRIIACDLDDVLAQTNQAVCNWHNETYGTSLELTNFYYYHYWKNPGWGTPEETMTKVHRFYESEAFRKLGLVAGAKEGLQALVERGFKVVVVTARGEDQRGMTEEWIQEWLPGLVDGIYFTGEFAPEKGKIDKITKSTICRTLSAVGLIDDNLNHVVTCAMSVPPIPCVLFGEYEWNRRWSGSDGEVEMMSYKERIARGDVGWWHEDNMNELPTSVIRARDWMQVVEVIFRED